jgi:2-desacetyl-2-hydroxyethyl bacteriochlorophyllide A dehydrogenase
MLIQVAACGVCGHDLLTRSGAFPGTQLPAVLGHEISGVVVETGAEINRFACGDRVALMQRMSCGACAECLTGRGNLCRSGAGFYGEDASGGYGEFVLATERNASILPDNISTEQGAILSCALGTGYHALRRAGVSAGDDILITGASGGVGIHAVKLAAIMGLRVIAVTSSEAKKQRIAAAGAHDVIVASELQFAQEVKDLTFGRGVDAVLEIVGRPTFVSSIRSLRIAGTLVIVGNVEPGSIELNPAISILKEINVIGSAHATISDLANVVRLVDRGKISPEIAEVVPRSEAARAHEMMQERQSAGRYVLTHAA